MVEVTKADLTRAEAESLACEIVGILAKATNNNVRRRALARALTIIRRKAEEKT